VNTLPPHRPGLRVGLYGGSFDPVHDGHRHVAETAFRRLRLDRVWWIVTPGNPLKTRAPADRLARLAAMRAAVRHPAMEVTDIDAAIGARYTIETIRYLQGHCPGVRFVWIMGADSLAGFDRWRDWREIACRVPLAVVDRPGFTLPALSSRTARSFAASRIDAAAADTLADREPPAWVFLFGRRSNLSSTALRIKSSRADSER
jgi:nicotinate-nucleotide adenylyltransferase